MVGENVLAEERAGSWDEGAGVLRRKPVPFPRCRERPVQGTLVTWLGLQGPVRRGPGRGFGSVLQSGSGMRDAGRSRFGKVTLAGCRWTGRWVRLGLGDPSLKKWGLGRRGVRADAAEGCGGGRLGLLILGGGGGGGALCRLGAGRWALGGS